ncbi:MAG: DUF763 domain-containing protein [Thaumarchaeota archaeon]|nr:DUF763 domain-containing protein [Candidatus Calditenuaceae archaeon]MDW8186794.1 DUF763 domain-containing protein [Nitrososphaerota archaeon]
MRWSSTRIDHHHRKVTRGVYEKLRVELRHISDSFIGYFGPERFVELLGDPAGLRGVAVLIGDETLSTGSVELLFRLLKDVLNLEWQVGVVGGSVNEKFRVPDELEALSNYMGLTAKEVNALKLASRMTAKVDSVAVQDGYDLYLHVMVFCTSGEWSVIQVGHKSVLGRLYQWYSGKARERSMVDEPHAMILAESKSRYSLDFTNSRNVELRKCSLSVLEEREAVLRRVQSSYRPAVQRSLAEFLEGLPDNDNPLMQPVRVRWNVISRLKSSPPESFEELLITNGVGKETLRFLAICSMTLYQVVPSLEDRAVLHADRAAMGVNSEQLVYDLREAIRYSKLPANVADERLRRLDDLMARLFGEKQN